MVQQTVSFVNNLNVCRGHHALNPCAVAVHNSVMAPQLDTSQHILVELMRARDASPTDIANYCNCSRELVYQWTKGNRRITDKKIRKLAEFFGVTESYMKYGTPPLDPDKVGEVATGAIEALVAAGVLHSSVSPAQIGHFIAQVCTDVEVEGDVNREQIARYIRILAPAAVIGGSSQTQ